MDVKCPAIDTNIPHLRCISHLESGLDLSYPRFRTPLPVSTWNSMRMAAAQNFDQEVCGFVDEAFDLHFVTNVHQNRRHNFRMHEREYADAIKRIMAMNRQIIGVFHTHPGGLGKPSAGDVDGWPNPALHWRYWIATQHDVYEWEYVNQP